MRDAVAGEVLVDERLLQADRFEDLRTGVRRDRRDAHLRHHLQDALARGLHVVLDRLALGDAAPITPSRHEVADRVEREVGVDRAGAVAEQQREVMHLARFAGLDDEPDARARLLAHEVVVHRGGDQQRGNRRVLGVGVTVGEDDEVRAVGDRLAHLRAHVVDRHAQAFAAVGDRVVAVHGERREPGDRVVAVVDVAQLARALRW